MGGVCCSSALGGGKLPAPLMALRWGAAGLCGASDLCPVSRIHLMRIRGTNTGTLASMLGKKPGLAFAREGGVAVQARHALTPLLPHTQAAR